MMKVCKNGGGADGVLGSVIIFYLLFLLDKIYLHIMQTIFM